MPKEFTKCVRNGGKIKTKDLGKGKYMHICYDKEGNTFPGEVLTKKKANVEVPQEKSKKTHEEVVSSAKATLATLDDLMKLKEHFDVHHAH